MNRKSSTRRSSTAPALFFCAHPAALPAGRWERGSIVDSGCRCELPALHLDTGRPPTRGLNLTQMERYAHDTAYSTAL